VDTMNSLMAQSYKDFEWVIIDGASTDETLALINPAKAHMPVTVISEPDKGIYDAMNKGLTNSRGQYCYFLNSDDRFFDENVLRGVAEVIDAGGGADLDMVYGSVMYTRDDGPDVLRTFSHINSKNIFIEDLCHQGIFASKRLFDRIGGFNCAYKINADYDWILRAFMSRAKARCIDNVISYFHVGGAHVKDKDFLASERKKVRLQYVGVVSLAWMDFSRRVRHRLYRMLHGHPIGQYTQKV
jgi:glycosyltransferase involved in cell wall biosynthesis